jgi:hypothetical protein
VIIVQGNLYLKCTCCEYEQCGYSCDSIFAIIDDIPSHHDIAIQCVVYLTENKKMDGLYDFLVENEKPGPSLPCNSVSEFRQDLAVGECTTNHAIDYFESTLPKNPPKIHPGCIWATIVPYALNEASRVPATTKPAAMKTIVSLSQAAQDHNDQYSEYVKDFASNDGKINAVDNNNDENFAGLDDHLDDYAGDVEDEVNKSVATYATKSPDRPSRHSHEDQRLQDMKATLKNTSLMSLAKPIFESIVNTGQYWCQC